MSLTQALNSALAGLQVTQAGLSVVAGNVANVQTPDYVRKTLDQIETGAGNTISVRTAAIRRVLDQILQTQWRTESAGGAYADSLDKLYQQLQQIYGAPGSSTGLDTQFNNFTTALQGLMASPASFAAQSNAVNSARIVAQTLNSLSAGIQTLRSAAEQGLSGDVAAANDALQQISAINRQIGAMQPGDATAVALMDKRDAYVNQLSQLMNVKVVQLDNNQISITTSNGIELVGLKAVQLSFDAQGSLTPDKAWSADPNERGVGTITLTPPGGASIDLIANGAINSGEIAAYLQMRDQILPQAQAQLDEFAAHLAQAASDVTTNGSAVSGSQSGFDIDTAGLQSGNTIQITYTDGSNVAHKVTIVRVDDPAALPLAGSVTADPNDTVVGVDFSGGMASVVTQLSTALGSTNLQFSNTGSVLHILNDVAHTITVNSASKTQSTTSLTGGSAQLPLFVDGANAYTGAITGNGSQFTGFAARISVNAAIAANPSYLVTYQTSPPTASGDPTRPAFLYDQFANTAYTYSPTSGIGGTVTPFSGQLSAFIGQIMEFQGQAATNASSLRQGQDIVVNALQDRLNQASGVNIDQEMTNLLNLQSAYGANARVLSAVKDMFAMLLNI